MKPSTRILLMQKRLLTPVFLRSRLALWLDAADSRTIILDGSTASQWRDKSGNNFHAFQSNPVNQPTYVADGLNGKPVLRFDASKLSVMTIPAGQLGGSTEASLFWVQQNVNDPALARVSAGAFIANDFGNDIVHNHIPWTDGIVYFQAFSTARIVIGNLTPSFASPRIIGAESRNSLFNFLVDDTVQFTTSTNTYANPSASKNIGTGNTNRSTNFLGNAAELVVVRGILSTFERQQLTGYFAHKWKLTANLANNHPFKFRPPYM